MYIPGVHVHYPSRLGASTHVLAAELLCGDGVLTMWTGECGQAVRHRDRVMSHIFKCSPVSCCDCEPKLLSPESASTSVAGERVDSTSQYFILSIHDGRNRMRRLSSPTPRLCRIAYNTSRLRRNADARQVSAFHLILSYR